MIRIGCGGVLLAFGCLFLLAAIGLLVDPATGPSDSAPWVVMAIGLTLLVAPGTMLCFWGWRAIQMRRSLEADASAAAIGRMLSRMSPDDARLFSERVASVNPEQGAAFASACAKLTVLLEPQCGMEKTQAILNGLTIQALIRLATIPEKNLSSVAQVLQKLSPEALPQISALIENPQQLESSKSDPAVGIAVGRIAYILARALAG